MIIDTKHSEVKDDKSEPKYEHSVVNDDKSESGHYGQIKSLTPGLNASFKALRLEMLCYYAAKCLSAEYASGKNYFDIGTYEDFNQWREEAWDQFLSEPFLKRIFYFNNNDAFFCYTKLAYITAMLTKCNSLQKQIESLPTDLTLRNDILDLLSKITSIVKSGIVPDNLDFPDKEYIFVHLLVQYFIASARHGIVSDTGAFLRAMNNNEIVEEFNKILNAKIPHTDIQKMEDLVCGIRKDIKCYTFVEFEEKYDWNFLFKEFWAFLKKISLDLICNGPFPRFHPLLPSLVRDSNNPKTIIPETQIPTKDIFLNAIPHDQNTLSPDEMKELFHYFRKHHSDLEKHFSSSSFTKKKRNPKKPKINPSFHTPVEDTHNKALHLPTSDNDTIDYENLPFVHYHKNTSLVHLNTSNLPDVSTINKYRRPRRQWNEDDINELARLLSIHHSSPQRWKKILDSGHKNNFFIGRSNVDLKDKARQMKELMIKQNKNPGIWMYAVDR